MSLNSKVLLYTQALQILAIIILSLEIMKHKMRNGTNSMTILFVISISLSLQMNALVEKILILAKI